jgi:hypothetical protein
MEISVNDVVACPVADVGLAEADSLADLPVEIIAYGQSAGSGSLDKGQCHRMNVAGEAHGHWAGSTMEFAWSQLVVFNPLQVRLQVGPIPT